MSFNVKDYYYKKAKDEKFLARSVYKLREIDRKYRIFIKGDRVIDLGYSPGSWVQYASQRIGPSGYVLGVDIQPINGQLNSLHNVELFQRDIFSLKKLEDLDHTDPMDVLLSDMAPSTTGIKNVDQIKSLELTTQTFSFMKNVLKKGGRSIIKVFDGPDARDFLKAHKKYFSKSHYFRPKATRSSSKEFFFVGLGYRG